MAYTDTQFLEIIKPYVISDMRTSSILASLTAAQAIIESNKGNSGLTQKANNLFGIKGSYNGQSVTMMTTEYYNGVATKVPAAFRKYPSWLESIQDHSNFLLKNKRYSNIKGLTDYKLACQYIQQDGYATSPTYAKTLQSTIEKYKLYLWDVEALGDYNPYVVGVTYTTNTDLNIRFSPSGEKVPYDCITENAKLHAKFSDEGTAILLKNTRVTCKATEIKNNKTWMQIPSGWICAIEKGKMYIV